MGRLIRARRSVTAEYSGRRIVATALTIFRQLPQRSAENRYSWPWPSSCFPARYVPAARDERHAVAAIPAGALSAAQAAATAFRKRAVIAGKYNYRVVAKAVAADCVKQPANAPVEFLHHIAVGACTGSICKGRGRNQGNVRCAVRQIKKERCV